MSVIGKALESGRKRARTEDDASCSTSAVGSKENAKVPSKVSASTILRANKMFSKLSALLKEFPEIKFIIEFENLQAHLETAVVEYIQEKETKKYEAQLLMNYNKEAVPLHSLPDEVLKNCLSFVGKGHYGVVGLVSKKLNEAYKEEFGQKTAYLEMATSVKLASHSLSELCKNLEEKDELLKAAAVNGNLDILRAAVKDGYDLFPLVALEKTTVYPCLDEDDDDYYDPEEYFEPFDVYYTNDDKKQYSWGPQKVNLAKLVERGHLHVLKYLHEELHYFLGLQRYIKPAIEHGKLDILEWLEDICIMDNDDLRIGFMDDYVLNNNLDFCECAIKSGNVESLEWLLESCYSINNENSVLEDAIKTKSIKMIEYCFDLGYDDFDSYSVEIAIKETKSVEVFRLLHELGYEFGEMKSWYEKYVMKDYFEIIKFLRSISIPWNDNIMKDIVKYGTLEMIQFAHKDGCTWTGEEFGHVLDSTRWSMEKFKYLIDNGCTVDYEQSSGLTWDLRRKKELVLLDYFVGKNSSFDNKLFKVILDFDGTWFEGISYLLEKGKDVQNFKSIEEVFHRNRGIDGIKYFHSLGLPWCLDSSRNTYLLSKIACYNSFEDVKWAYENGCSGGNLVPFVKDEWKEFGIRHSSSWKANCVFFEENGMLDESFLEKSGLKKLDPKNVEEIGDAQLDSLCMSRNTSFFLLNFCSLKNLVDHGYTFCFESEKESVCEEAYKTCCAYSQNEEHRKRLALFVGMRVRDNDY